MPQSSRRTVSALALTASVVILGSVAPAATAATCAPKGSRTVASNKLARVYTSADRNRLFGCLRSSGRSVLLVDRAPADDPYTTRTYAQVRLAGRYVGWYSVITDQSCKADCPPDYDATTEYVSAVDLKSRRSRAVKAIAKGVAVSTGGRLAWVQAGADNDELHLSRAGHENAMVDSGQITSFFFSASHLLWRNGGVGRWTD